MNWKTAILAAALSAMGATHAFAGPVLDRIKSSGELVAAADTASPPTSFMDKDNQLAGFDIDVTNEVARRLGVKARFVTPSWDVITAGHWSGRWDVSIASMTPTIERAKVLDFPVIYYAAPAALVVNKANATIKVPSDASGKRIGVQGGSTYEKYLQHNLQIDVEGAPGIKFQIKDANIVAYDTEGLSLDDLRLGDGTRLDAVTASVQVIEGAIRSGYPIRRVGDPLFFEPIAIAIDKGDPELGATLKSTIKAMRDDGTLKQLSEKWFKVDLTQPLTAQQ
ncbi:transporter substrate-binding domain-containing protein [Labrys neptuniae]